MEENPTILLIDRDLNFMIFALTHHGVIRDLTICSCNLANRTELQKY